jgi:hypothetical protein
VRAAALGIVALLAVGLAGTAAALATPAPTPTPHPGGLAPHATPAAPAPGVVIVKGAAPSCTGYASQTVPPATIRVLVHDAVTGPRVATVDFETYVENVLPNEWIASWDAEAIKAGAVAVKSYAWYWVTHYGGYLVDPANCFDVTDDTSFQVYRAGSANPRTDDAVRATWNVVATNSDATVRQTSYRASLTTHPLTETCGEGATGATMSQYGTQACAQAGKTYAQILATYYFPDYVLAATGSLVQQQLTPDDFHLDGRSDPAVFDPRTGMWSISGSAPFDFGTVGDVPAITNAGDGWARAGVFRPSTGTWFRLDPLAGASAVQFGAPGDLPVQAHYDGASKPTVLAVYRPATGTWYLRGHRASQYGARDDIPVPGHYAGGSAADYADQLAVYRPATGTWYVRGLPAVQFGARGDIPVPGDYNGDGLTDLAVYRPATGTWYVRGRPAVQFGAPGDIPVTGDYNGDGATDLAVFRPGNGSWFVRGRPRIILGSTGDLPIGRAPLSD